MLCCVVLCDAILRYDMVMYATSMMLYIVKKYCGLLCW